MYNQKSFLPCTQVRQLYSRLEFHYLGLDGLRFRIGVYCLGLGPKRTRKINEEGQKRLIPGRSVI